MSLKINLHCAFKDNDAPYSEIAEHYKKMISKYADFNDYVYYNDEIKNAQKYSANDAIKTYEKIYTGKLDGFNIAFSPSGEELSSEEFAKVIEKNTGKMNLFIGGGYGLSDEFLQKNNAVVSFGRMTMGHKLARLVVLEQIWRALSIINSHPYHK